MYRNNCYVAYNDDIGEIQSILCQDQQLFILVKPLVIEDIHPFCDSETGYIAHLRKSSRTIADLHVLSADDAIGNCVIMPVDGVSYIGTFPNYVAIN